jgi:hypothetical protein
VGDMSNGKRARAVVTMSKNESVFLPIWWRYYSQFFGPEDIYILDHETTDGSTSGPGFVRIPVFHPVVEWGWHRDILQKHQHWLVERYEAVLCTDVDEIVAPEPGTGNLGDYIERFTSDFVNCRGYEILHLKDSEPPLDFTRPILEQRMHWYFNPAYCKPLLARVPMFWHGGLHVRVDGQTNEDPSLYLIHLHRVDYRTCLARHQQRVSQPWNKRDWDEGWGYQNRITDPAEFHHWFYQDSCSGLPINLERIPIHWRGLI